MKIKRKAAIVILVIILPAVLAACGGSAPAANTLPTATPAPTLEPPTPTATLAPPPTVTPFPTATPGGELVPTPADEGIAVAEGTPTEASGEAQPSGPTETAPTEAPQAAESPAPSGGGATAPDTISQGDLVFETDFLSGWPTIKDDVSKLSVVKDAYVFSLDPNVRRFVNTTAINRADFYAQVNVTPAACPDGGGYGLFFRMKDTSNYYALTYFCSGRVTVFSRANGTLNTTALLDTQLPGSSKADSPDLHTIGVQAKGTDFVVVFDGQTVGTFSDESQKEGDIAIYAVSATNAALKVGFSNLEVWTVR